MLDRLKSMTDRNRSRRRRPDDTVSEPDLRIVMAALALGLVVGAFTGESSDAADGVAAAELPVTRATLEH